MKTQKQAIDTDDIELDEFDANELNAQMYEMVEAFVYALGRQAKGSLESAELPQSLLRVFITTHKSMLLLMNRDVDDPLMVADAISLVREQVEKVYVLALLGDDDIKWTRYVQDRSVQVFLRRWYKEYQWLCRYSHIAADKVFLDVASQSRSFYEGQRFDMERERRMQDAAMISYLAVASGFAEVSKKLQRDYGAIEQLGDFWNTLRRISLDGRKLWDIYVGPLLMNEEVS
jgi:hypothetical protein